MKRFGTIAALAAVIIVLGAATFTSRSSEARTTEKAPKLDDIKKLVGDWVKIGADGKPEEKIAITYRVTAGGSAVLETIFPGTDEEMISVYHEDKGRLVLTHYCMLGNQPHMVARAGDKDGVIVFDFESCGNLADPNAPHMHDSKMTIVDDRHFETSCGLFVGGKLKEKHDFKFARTEPPKPK